MSRQNRCKNIVRRARPLSIPAYLIIRDFAIGLSVPYMLASDGVSSFFFFLILVEPELWLGNELHGKAL